MRRAPELLLLATLALGAELGAQTVVELPPGRIATLFQTARRLAAPAAPPPVAWPAWSDTGPSGWGGPEPWRRWVELLRAEAHAETPDPERRAALALLAIVQGRSAEAWVHLETLGPSPLAEAVLPALMPGAPQRRLASTEPLPSGVRLTPGLPPPHDAFLEQGAVDRIEALLGRTMRVPSLVVGETRLEMRVIVEGDGVQVDLVHLEGPAVSVELVLPVPGGVELGDVYANWEKIGRGPFPIAVDVRPEPRRSTVWGRFRPRSERWPAPPPGERPAVGRGEILIVVPRERLGEPRLQRLGEALGELFGRATRLTTPADARAARFFEPTAIHLGPLPTTDASSLSALAHDRKLLGLLRMVEAHALAGGAAR